MTMKAAFNESFQAGGKPEAQRTSECNKFKKPEFEKLSEEEQLWNNRAKKDHQDMKDAYQNHRDSLPEMLPPKEAQQCIPLFHMFVLALTFSIRALNELLNVLGPVIQGLRQALGMHVTLLLGGPELKKKGVLNIIRYLVVHDLSYEQGTCPETLGSS